MDSILKLEGVSYVYGRGTPFEKHALKNINISFPKGKITGLIGHTGSGKSTLVNLLNGLYRPSDGKVYLDGTDIWEKPKEISSVRYRVGLVMQYPEYQLFDDTVRADIAFGPKNQGLSAEEITERVKTAAEFTGLTEELLDKSPFELSGGQKRRAAIAGIMAMRPDVLVLDEPAAGLDPKGREEILGGLVRYSRENGVSVILVSHSMEDMARYCDNIVVMNDGEVYAFGSTEEVFANALELESIGLTIPMIAKIAARLKENGVELRGKLYTVDGVFDAIKNYIGGMTL